MQSFEWVDAVSVAQAATLTKDSQPGKPVLAKAGGLDLLDLIKEGVLKPSRLVNLKTIPGLDGIEMKDGLSLGALVTLNTIDKHAEIRKTYVALAEAAGHAATPQVRNAATIGGNLLQKPRCWYYRHHHFHAFPGDHTARVAEGENQYHAIFDTDKSPMTQASTPATALTAYDASVELTAADGKTRLVKLTDFYTAPTMDKPTDTVLQPGEILTRVLVPALPAGTKAAYHKQTERDSYDWPICDVAVVLTMDGDAVKAARIVAGWVAPTPRRFPAAEAALVGKPLNEETAAAAAKAAVADAKPLSKNAYKVPILETVVRRTILQAAKA